jgi:hypothetical protein
VHGLNGHREKTWTAGNGVHWLRDLLPHNMPRARILSWGYDANTHSGSRVSCEYLYNHAQTLVSDLCLERQLTEVSGEQTEHWTQLSQDRRAGGRSSSWRTAWAASS